MDSHPLSCGGHDPPSHHPSSRRLDHVRRRSVERWSICLHRSRHRSSRYVAVVPECFRSLQRQRSFVITTLNVSCGFSNLIRSEEHTSELQSRLHLVCRLLLEKKKKNK